MDYDESVLGEKEGSVASAYLHHFGDEAGERIVDAVVPANALTEAYQMIHSPALSGAASMPSSTLCLDAFVVVGKTLLQPLVHPRCAMPPDVALLPSHVPYEVGVIGSSQLRWDVEKEAPFLHLLPLLFAYTVHNKASGLMPGYYFDDGDGGGGGGGCSNVLSVHVLAALVSTHWHSAPCTTKGCMQHSPALNHAPYPSLCESKFSRVLSLLD